MPQSMATTKNPTRESPNDLLADVHDRMPVISPPNIMIVGSTPGFTLSNLSLALLMPYDSALMRRYPVSARVNVVTNDGPECSAPVDLPAQTGSLFG